MSGTQTYPIVNTFSNHSLAPPPLSIMPYFYPYSSSDSTKSDPDGWVICDGNKRTVTDGRFSVVAPLLNTVMGVTTNDSNNITPPNLTGKFLYGASSPNTINSTGGSSSITLTTDNLPAHKHDITDPGHAHGITDGGHSHKDRWLNSFSGGTLGYGGSNGTLGNSYNTYGATTGITINSATTGITTNNTGNGNAFDSLPPYVTINYIMKY